MKYQLAEKHIDVNEHHIRYLQGGVVSSAKPIVFIHGWAVGTEPYQEALTSLCQHYQVIAPELPGFGTSGSRADWDYNKYANFLIAFLAKLNIKKSHLVGHSLGGGIAATLAALMPNLVASLVLAGSTGIPVDPIPKVLFQRAIELTVGVPQMRLPQVVQMLQSLLYNICFRTQNTIQTLFVALEKDIKPLLPRIVSPCLLVWGADDLTTPLIAGQGFAQQIRGSEMVVVEGAYHEWNVFRVEQFSAIVLDFINRIEAKQ